MIRTAELDIIFFGSAMQGTVLVTTHQDRKGVFQLKGKLELSAKWQGSSKAEKRKAAKNRIKNAYDNEAEVEIVPAVSELEADKPKIIRVAAYCRVSTDEDAQAGSYELQVQYYTELITRNPDWELVKIYADEGISGTNVTKRMQFQEMIRDCYDGKIDLIITKSISRFARNTLDCISYVRQLRSLEPPVAVFFENENLNTTDRRNEAFIAMLSSVAQGESENKSEAIKWSIKRRFQKGLPLCPTWALLGYTTDDDGNMTVVEDEAAVVRFIYENYLDGWSVKEIADELTRLEIPTVKGMGKWSAGTLYSMLHNERYCGDVVMQKTYTPDCLSHRSVKNRGQERKYNMRDHHPAIIPREQWDEVQECLKTRRRRRKKQIRQDTSVTLQFIRRGRMKGYLVLDPHWSKRDVPKIQEKLQKRGNVKC